MKKVIVFLLFSLPLQLLAQKPATIQSDTVSVWVVYLDSVRVFAAYPGVDMRTEVVAGWMVVSVIKSGFEFIREEKYFDTEGVEFDNDMVLFAKRRKVTPNPFRQ